MWWKYAFELTRRFVLGKESARSLVRLIGDKKCQSRYIDLVKRAYAAREANSTLTPVEEAAILNIEDTYPMEFLVVSRQLACADIVKDKRSKMAAAKKKEEEDKSKSYFSSAASYLGFGTKKKEQSSGI